MTFEEMQKTIEGMLAVQKELHSAQLRFAESSTELRESDIVQRMQSLERRVDRLEQKSGNR